MKATKLVAVLAAAGLVLAACGDDDDDDAASTDTTAAEATDTTAAGATDTTAAGATDTTAAGGDRHHRRRRGDDGRRAARRPAPMPPADCEAARADRGAQHRSRHRRRQGGRQVVQPVGVGGRAGCGRDGRRSPPNYIETAAATDYANNIGQFVDDGANVIVTAGSALTEATAAAAADNPDVTFIGIDQIQATPICNLTGLVFAEDKAGFLAGALAGLLTESDTHRLGARHRPGAAGRRLRARASRTGPSTPTRASRSSRPTTRVVSTWPSPTPNGVRPRPARPSTTGPTSCSAPAV